MLLGLAILGLALLAFVHFVIDGIVAPSEHMLIRCELLHKAHELEELAGRESLPKDVFIAVRKTIHGLVNHMPRFTLLTVLNIQRDLDHDNSLRHEVEERIAALDRCQLDGLVAIRRRVERLADQTLTWNSAGWMIFVVPVAIAIFMYRSTTRTVNAMLTLPDKELQRFDMPAMSAFDNRSTV